MGLHVNNDLDYLMNNLIIITKSFLINLSVSILILGCAASNPRFYTKETINDTDPEKERILEDDKKVDIKTIKKRLTNTNIDDREILMRDKILTEVLNLIGSPYSYGGRKDDSFDCSLFSSQIYEKIFGIKLPRSTDEQYQIGEKISFSDLKLGDLIFFNTTGRIPSHVGIYLGDELFAHASRSEGVTISSLQSTYYKKRYLGARRVIN